MTSKIIYIKNKKNKNETCDCCIGDASQNLLSHDGKNPEKHLTPGSSLITKVRLILWNDVGSENIYLLFNKCL